MYRGGPTYNTYVAPPVYGGYGYGGGFSLFPTFVSPVFGFGGERGLGSRLWVSVRVSLRSWAYVRSVYHDGYGGGFFLLHTF